jgi:uncharacterized protein with PIN domain
VNGEERSPFGVHRSAFGGAGTVHTEHGKVNARESWFGRRAETGEEKIDQRFDSVALAKATGFPLLFKGEDFGKTDIQAAM